MCAQAQNQPCDILPLLTLVHVKGSAAIACLWYMFGYPLAEYGTFWYARPRHSAAGRRRDEIQIDVVIGE